MDDSVSPSEEYVIILEEGLEAFNFWADESLLGIALLFYMGMPLGF